MSADQQEELLLFYTSTRQRELLLPDQTTKLFVLMRVSSVRSGACFPPSLKVFLLEPPVRATCAILGWHIEIVMKSVIPEPISL
jgi:hypothetical protein